MLVLTTHHSLVTHTSKYGWAVNLHAHKQSLQNWSFPTSTSLPNMQGIEFDSQAYATLVFGDVHLTII